MGERVYIPTKSEIEKTLQLIGETNDSGGVLIRAV